MAHQGTQAQVAATSETALHGFVPTRRCTDLFCLILYVFLFLCTWCLAGYSFNEGYPGRLQRGTDVYGNVCGMGELEDRPYTFFGDPDRSLRVTLCLSGCPVVTAMEGICSYTPDLVEDIDHECFDAYPSKPFYNKYCMPADHYLRSIVYDHLTSADAVMTRVVGDLARAWGLLSIAGLITGGALVLYLASMQVACKY
jgi:hypothetical protein